MTALQMEIREESEHPTIATTATRPFTTTAPSATAAKYQIGGPEPPKVNSPPGIPSEEPQEARSSEEARR